MKKCKDMEIGLALKSNPIQAPRTVHRARRLAMDVAIVIAAIVMALGVWSDAGGWSSKTASDSIGTVQTGGFRLDSLIFPSGADPMWFGQNLIRSIYFEDTLGYVVSKDSSGSASINRSRTYTTGRFQFAPAVDGTKAANSYWLKNRPKFFEVLLWLVPSNVDSLGPTNRSFCHLPYAKVLLYDSFASTKALLPADSSNIFIKTGNYNKSTYGTRLFEVQKDTVDKRMYPLYVTDGAYIQLYFSGDSTISGYTTSTRNVKLRGLLRMWGN